MVQTLDRACKIFGYPKSIRTDNGPEFISRDLDLWAYQNDVIPDFSRPDKPTDNAFIKLFNVIRVNDIQEDFIHMAGA